MEEKERENMMDHAVPQDEFLQVDSSKITTTYESMIIATAVPHKKSPLMNTSGRKKSKRSRMGYGSTPKGEGEIHLGKTDQEEIMRQIQIEMNLNNDPIRTENKFYDDSSVDSKLSSSSNESQQEESFQLSDSNHNTCNVKDAENGNESGNDYNINNSQEELIVDCSQTNANQAETKSNQIESQEDLVFDSSQIEKNQAKLVLPGSPPLQSSATKTKAENKISGKNFGSQESALEHHIVKFSPVETDAIIPERHSIEYSTETKNDGNIHTPNTHQEFKPIPNVISPKHSDEITDSNTKCAKTADDTLNILPSDAEILKSTNELFANADKDSCTVGDIVRSIEANYKIKLTKNKKKMVQSRLIDLIKGVRKIESKDEDDMSATFLEGEVQKQERGESANEDNDSDYDENIDDEEWTENTNINTKRSKLNKSKSNEKNYHHLRKANYLIQKQKDMEKVMQEEIAAAAADNEKQQSKEDLRRIENIRKKFETDTDEALQTRFEDRLGLLDKLKKKRMQIFCSNNFEDIEEKKDDTRVNEDKNVEAKIKEELEQKEEVIKNDINNSPLKLSYPLINDTTEESEDDSDEEELIFITSKPKQNIALSLLETKSPAKKCNVKKVANTRLLLRQNLKHRQIKAGNNWLARELGYKNEEEHILDCQRTEKKRKILLMKEEEKNMKRLDAKIDTFSYHSDDQKDDSDDGEAEIDEDLLLAQEIEAENNEKRNVNKNDEDSPNDHEFEADTELEQKENDTDNEVNSRNQVKGIQIEKEPMKGEKECIESDRKDQNYVVDSCEFVSTSIDIGSTSRAQEPISSQSVSATPLMMNSNTNKSSAVSALVESDIDVATQPDLSPNSFNEKKGTIDVKKNRNLAWQAMLKKEAQSVKNRKKNTLVETEADEEEEEEAVTGLEDFGFSVSKKHDDDDDEDEKHLEAKDGDLENVVDDLSDGEGDEEAGALGRKAMQQKEEKEKHKEIMRRMRDGYDGRRGGIGGGTARGIHRFDQITAADNRRDAKRLGLLNDDEMDSDEEMQLEDGEKEEDEDEHALLDQMLKDRFLNRKDEKLVFSDDENEDDDDLDVENVKPETTGDKEEKEQERIAKIFAKRARMNHLLSLYDGHGEFSQSRINEDQRFKQDLNSIKCFFSKARRKSSTSSTFSSISKSPRDGYGLQESSQLLGSLDGKLDTLSRSSSLSLSIGSKHRSKKRKTNFFGSDKDKNNTKGKDIIYKSAHKGIPLSHVGFHNNTSSSLKQTHEKNSCKPHPARNYSKNHPAIKRVAASEAGATKKIISKGGLWSKVSQNRFNRI